jgi:hypothetical protein
MIYHEPLFGHQAPPSRGIAETMALLTSNSSDNIKALHELRDAAALKVAGRPPVRKQIKAVVVPTRLKVSVDRAVRGLRAVTGAPPRRQHGPAQQPVVKEDVPKTSQPMVRKALSTSKPVAAKNPWGQIVEAIEALKPTEVPAPRLRLTAENLRLLELEGQRAEGARKEPSEISSSSGTFEDEGAEGESTDAIPRCKSPKEETADDSDDATIVADEEPSSTFPLRPRLPTGPPYHPRSSDGKICLNTLKRALLMPPSTTSFEVQTFLSRNLSIIRHVYFNLLPQPYRFEALDCCEMKTQTGVGRWINNKMYEAIRDLAWDNMPIKLVVAAIERKPMRLPAPGVAIGEAKRPASEVEEQPKTAESSASPRCFIRPKPTPPRDASLVHRTLRKARRNRDTRVQAKRAGGFRERKGSIRPQSPLRESTRPGE